MTPESWVPYLLAAGNVGSALCTGRKLTVGWPLLIVTQVGFVAYALVTGQYGFIFQNIAMAAIGAYNWRKWKRPEADKVEPKTLEPSSRG